jgi:hypothetical protein
MQRRSALQGLAVNVHPKSCQRLYARVVPIHDCLHTRFKGTRHYCTLQKQLTCKVLVLLHLIGQNQMCKSILNSHFTLLPLPQIFLSSRSPPCNLRHNHHLPSCRTWWRGERPLLSLRFRSAPSAASTSRHWSKPFCAAM